MKKTLILLSLSVVFLTMFFLLTSCSSNTSNERGIITDKPENVFTELLKLYTEGEDFADLCALSLDEKDVSDALDDWKSCGEYYAVVENGENIYKNLTGSDFKEKDNLSILGFYGGTDFLKIVGKGYIVIEYNPKTEKYMLNEIDFNSSK